LSNFFVTFVFEAAALSSALVSKHFPLNLFAFFHQARMVIEKVMYTDSKLIGANKEK